MDLLVLREIVLLDGNEPALVSLLLERCNGRQQLDITAELDELRPIAEMCDSEIVNSFDQALAAPDFKPAKK